MRRREFISVVGGAAAWPVVARGQQAGNVHRIGVFVPGSVQTHGKYVTTLRNALNTLGYIEGSNYVLLVRWGEGNFGSFSDYARELVQAEPKVILATGTAVAAAVKGQTSIVPVIFVQVSDPIGGGFVGSLSRPGNNFTGFANYEPAMTTLSAVAAGRRFGRYRGKSRHRAKTPKTTRLTHSDTSPPSIDAMQKGFLPQ